jgi:hypothetical protein
MNKNERFNIIRNIKLELSGEKINTKPNKMEEGDMENPCWEGYEPYGTKVVDGREVPNCVPVEAKKVKEGFPVPSPSGDEDENAFVSRCISEIIDEYGQEQAAAICYSKWREE